MCTEARIGLAVITILLVAFGVLLVKRFTDGGDLPAAEIPAEVDGKIAGFKLSQIAKFNQSKASEPPRLAANEDIPPTPSEWSLAEVSDSVHEISGRRLSFMPKVDPIVAQPTQLIVVEESAEVAPVDGYLAVPVEAGVKVPDDTSPHTLHAESLASGEPNAGRYARLQPLGPSLEIIEEVDPRGVPVEAMTAEPEPGRFAPTNYDESSAGPHGLEAPAPLHQHASRYETSQSELPINQRHSSTVSSVPPAIERSQSWQTADRVAQQPSYDLGPPRRPVQPVGTGATRENNNAQYVVQPNDNIWKISEKVYGSGAYFRALIQHNSRWLENPRELRIGDVVRTPSVRELTEKYPELCPKVRRGAGEGGRFSSVGVSRNGPTREYHVRENDTLFDIARFELGEASRWVEIYELNSDVLTEDFNYLPPGTLLRLPMRIAPSVEDQEEVLTQQPSGTIRQ